MEPQSESPVPSSLVLDSHAKSYLLETAKWAKFLAIIGFVFIGFMVIAALTLGAFMSRIYDLAEVPELQNFGGSFVTIIYLIMALLYFFPTLYLYRFAVRTKSALLASNGEELKGGLQNLKATFKYMGIFMIIALCFYALMIVLGILGAVIGGLVGGEIFNT